MTDYIKVPSVDEAKRIREAALPVESVCPHVVTHGTTSHCTLAQKDAEDAERYRWLREHYRDSIGHSSVWLWLQSNDLLYGGLDATIDSARKG